MTLFWFICVALALAVVVIIVQPLLKGGASAAKKTVSVDGAIDAEIDALRRDQMFGLVDDKTARLLESALTSGEGDEKAAAAAPGVFRAGRIAALVALAIAPLLAILIYFKVGAPQMFDPDWREAAVNAAAQAPGAGGVSPEQADAIAAMPEEDRRAMIESMVTGLADRLQENPDDPAGWRMLARSYLVLGRTDDSVAAWREALRHGEQSADDWRQFAYALLEAQGGAREEINAELEEALERLRALEPDDPLALFILGQAAFNRGEKEKARSLWTRLKAVLPPDAPVMPTIDRLLSDIE